MNEHHARIVALARQGLSAAEIIDRMRPDAVDLNVVKRALRYVRVQRIHDWAGVPRVTAESQRERILDDWATGRFSRQALAAKYDIVVSSLMGNIIYPARAKGDRRAMTVKELEQAKTPKPAPNPRSPSLAETFGISPGRVVEVRDHASGRINRITLSGGFARDAQP